MLKPPGIYKDFRIFQKFPKKSMDRGLMLHGDKALSIFEHMDARTNGVLYIEYLAPGTGDDELLPRLL